MGQADGRKIEFTVFFGKQPQALLAGPPLPLRLQPADRAAQDVGHQAEKILGYPVARWYERDFWVAQIQQTAMGREDITESQRRPFWLVLDEFQNYVSTAISTLLEETGKDTAEVIVIGKVDDSDPSPILRVESAMLPRSRG